QPTSWAASDVYKRQFYAFIRIRLDSQKFQSDYVFIKNDRMAVFVGGWCLVVTIIATLFGVLPQDAPYGSSLFWHELIINIVGIAVLIGLGFIMPTLAKREREKSA
ncbi:hypothetical protein KQJ29_24155, partial [Enterococcus sp. S181_ASV_20]|nr:hypothetical protein [Enterococcus sp. S181_ASV_20]